MASMILFGSPQWKCRSGEVWEITTLILSKTDSLIKTGGILTGSRLLRWECSGELDCQVACFNSPHCGKTTLQGFSPSPGTNQQLHNIMTTLLQSTQQAGRQGCREEGTRQLQIEESSKQRPNKAMFYSAEI
ncbi:uncharacterized protein AB9W97_017553 isoform 2-T11 [Spinachia spinachia]